MTAGKPSPRKGENLSTNHRCTVLRKCPGIHSLRDRFPRPAIFLRRLVKCLTRNQPSEVHSTTQAHKIS